MASGFLILVDARCFAACHGVYDAVLRSVLLALPPADPLRAWLATQLPDDGDVDLGYAFVRVRDGSHVERHLDLRWFGAAIQARFEDAALLAEPFAGPYAPLADVAAALSRLREMIRRCRAGEAPLLLSSWNVVAPPPDMSIGTDWQPTGWHADEPDEASP
jgi:hypothetical protein